MAASAPILVRATRGALVESEHRCAVALWRGDSLVWSAGDADRPHYLRSSLKPWQALATIEILLDAGFALSDDEIAVIAASHSGLPEQTALVAGLLARGGLAPADLQCGAHPPLDEGAARALWARGEEPATLHHNCSGKHAGMLLACRAAGWSRDDYRDPEHPVQARIREVFALFCGVPAGEIAVGIDGCGAPALAVPLAAAARAFARIGAPGSVPFPEAPWRRLLAAATRRPETYCGPGRFLSRAAALLGDRFFGKDGAEGFMGFALRESGAGVALKVLDGGQRAVEPLASALLFRLLGDRLSDAERRTLEGWANPVLRNWSGAEVGKIEAVLPEGPPA